MICDCYEFRRVLVNFCKEILPKGNEEPERLVFEEFLSEHIIDVALDLEPCSSEICTATVQSLLELNCRKIKVSLPSVLVDLMTVCLIDDCSRKYTDYLYDFHDPKDFYNDLETYKIICASRGNREVSVEFTELLLRNGFLSSLPGDSSLLTEELNKEFTYFM